MSGFKKELYIRAQRVKIPFPTKFQPSQPLFRHFVQKVVDTLSVDQKFRHIRNQHIKLPLQLCFEADTVKKVKSRAEPLLIKC